MAKIIINEEIGQNGFNSKSLHDQLPKNKNEDLDVYIDSIGGDVTTGWSIYDTLKKWKGKKTVWITGIAASISSLIALSGNKINIIAGGAVLIHDPYITSKITGFNEDSVKARIPQLKELSEALVVEYQKRTKLSSKTISDMMHKETVMTAKQALKYKFVDAIYDSGIAAKIDTTKLVNFISNESIVKIDCKLKLISTAKRENKMEEETIVEETETKKVDPSIDLKDMSPEEVLAYTEQLQEAYVELELKLAELEDAKSEVTEEEKIDPEVAKAQIIDELFASELIGKAQAKLLASKSLMFVEARAEVIKAKTSVAPVAKKIVEAKKTTDTVENCLTMSKHDAATFKAKFGVEPSGVKIV